MNKKTRSIIERIAKERGVSSQHVETEMRKAIRAAMTSTDPRAQALWQQLAPDGKEPDIGDFIVFLAKSVNDQI